MLELRRRGLTAPTVDFEQAPYWMADHAGQTEAWEADVRFLQIMAGWQSGKTDFAVWYTLREIGRVGPGEGLVCAPTYPLLMVALQPRLVREVESRNLGEHKRGDGYIRIPYDSLRRMGYQGDEKGHHDVFLRHTTEAKHVEAITALYCTGDECGQMHDEVGEAIQGRLSATGGRACLISRHYNDNWFSRACQEPDQPGFSKTVSFASWDNPGWRKDLRPIPGALEAEIARLRRSMPQHRFDGKFAGKVTKPAGLIIDNWEDRFEVEPFLVPATWKRFTFHDFGNVHAFVISVAEHPTDTDDDGYPVLICYREHFPNQATASWQIVRDVKKADLADFKEWEAESGEDAPLWHVRGIGGATTEDKWRFDYSTHGLHVEKPMVGDPGTQIDRLYACVGRGGLRIVKDACPNLLQMLKDWSYEVDDAGEPIPGKIKDDEKFHGPAALRYGVSQLRPGKSPPKDEKPTFPFGSRGWMDAHAKKEAERSASYGA